MMQNFDDFVSELLKAGFSVAEGGSEKNVFGLIEHSWNEEPPDSPIRWHTGNPKTDPWEWRIRVLKERNDIAYSKLFFRKSGYITKKWYPYFLSVRRGRKTLEEEYFDGTISQFAKRIYDVIGEYGDLPLHSIKQFAGFSSEDRSKFDSALTDLQMKMYLSICGIQHKISQQGKEYAWPSTVLCTTEQFFGDETFEQAAKIKPDEAIEKIKKQIYLLNPLAAEKKIIKFIKG